MQHFFVDREPEQQAFREALDALYAKPAQPQLLLFHGNSDMVKAAVCASGVNYSF